MREKGVELAEGELVHVGTCRTLACGDFLAVGRVAWDYITGRRDRGWRTRCFPTSSILMLGSNQNSAQEVDFPANRIYCTK